MMEVLYEIRHVTRYQYAGSVTLSHHVAHLLPRACHRQKTLFRHLEIDPAPSSLRQRDDYFDNPVSLFTVEQGHSTLTVSVVDRIRVAPPDPPQPEATPAWETVAALLVNPPAAVSQGEVENSLSHEAEATEPCADVLDASDFIHASPMVPLVPGLRSLAEECFPPGRPILLGAMHLTHLIHDRFSYDPAATDVTTPLADVVQTKSGVCQDFAHVMIGALRSLGLAARYVSGYLMTGNSLPPDPVNGADEGGSAGGSADAATGLVGADATHAWVSVWIPDHGWVDLDPTNDKFALHEHVVVAWGRDFDEVSPIKGVMVGGGEHTIHVEVCVRPQNGCRPTPVPHLFADHSEQGTDPPRAEPPSLTNTGAGARAGHGENEEQK